MEFSNQLVEKWKPVLEHSALPEITDKYRKQVTAILLENQEKAAREEIAVGMGSGLLTEAAPTSNTGGTAATQRMTILEGGNVGIGVTAPVRALEIGATTATIRLTDTNATNDENGVPPGFMITDISGVYRMKNVR